MQPYTREIGKTMRGKRGTHRIGSDAGSQTYLDSPSLSQTSACLGRFSLFFAILFLLCIGVVCRVAAAQTVATSTPGQAARGGTQPSKALIPGVPFLSWVDGARMEYAGSQVQNPSYRACKAIVLKYWGQDLKALGYPKAELVKSGDWIDASKGEGGSLDELKKYVNRGIPVLVSPALTPAAHPLYPIHSMLIQAGSVPGLTMDDLQKRNLSSRGFGFLVELSVFPKLDLQFQGGTEYGVKRDQGETRIEKSTGKEQKIKFRSLRESVLLASRLIIGYDDERRKLIMHDPLFGPAFELSYEDFDKMWGPTGQGFEVLYPSNFAKARHPVAGAYRSRSPDEQSAHHFVFGYALASVGRGAEAQEEFKSGLKVPNQGRFFRFMLLMESAVVHYKMRKDDLAIAAAQKAVEAVPENPNGWNVLAMIYRDSSMPNREQKAAEAEQKAAALARDPKTIEEVARKITPFNFYAWASSLPN